MSLARPPRRAAEQRDELAPPHSITSSARASIRAKIVGVAQGIVEGAVSSVARVEEEAVAAASTIEVSPDDLACGVDAAGNGTVVGQGIVEGGVAAAASLMRPQDRRRNRPSANPSRPHPTGQRRSVGF